MTEAAQLRRAYDSPRRRRQAAQTRQAVLETATRLFAERGWAATGMRDIAREAEVAVETVYANFKSKTDLLATAIDVAVVGDDKPVPMRERTEFTAIGVGTRRTRIAAAAALITDINRRTSGVNLALREAASSDPQLDEYMRVREEDRWTDIGHGLELFTGRPADPRTTDALWAVFDVAVYRLLTDLRGWSDDEYREWLVDTIDRLVDRR